MKIAQHIALLILLINCISCDNTDLAEKKEESPKGYISLIDDDTIDLNHVNLFHEICVDNDIIGTFAHITSVGNTNPEVISLLHQYETEGFQVASHCWKQRNYYRWSQNLDLTVKNAQKVDVGDTYQYVSKEGTITLDVEEVHLNDLEEQHIYFNFIEKQQDPPSSKIGFFKKVSGNGDCLLWFTNYEIREFRDEVKVRADLDQLKKDFDQHGFLDWQYFVSPYGSKDEGLQRIAKEMGFKCLVSIANCDFIDDECRAGRYEIPRFSLNNYDSPGRSLSDLEEVIDLVAAKNGWILIGTHVYSGWTKEQFETRFKRFVKYAKAKGLKFVTLKEGFERYKCVFDRSKK